MIHPIDRSRAIDRFERIPRLAFGHYPTPVEKLPRLRDAIGDGPRIWIKRDDYTGPAFGGNKVRKLEYVLHAAVSSGADAVITCGGIASNHCRVTAILAARAGLECHLVLNRSDQPAKPASLACSELAGATIHFVNGRAERAPAMEALAAELRTKRHKVEVIPLGASTPLGAMGYVAAAAELAGQMQAKELRFDAVFFSSSSGGTHAGLAVGRVLFLPPGVQMYGVSPDDPADSIRVTVESIIMGMSDRLGVAVEPGLTVLDGYVGEGYGIESEAGREALDLLARSEGILLDPVYTAKAMACLIDWVRRGKLDPQHNVLFWHTGGQMALFHQ